MLEMLEICAFGMNRTLQSLKLCSFRVTMIILMKLSRCSCNDRLQCVNNYNLASSIVIKSTIADNWMQIIWARSFDIFSDQFKISDFTCGVDKYDLPWDFIEGQLMCITFWSSFVASAWAETYGAQCAFLRCCCFSRRVSKCDSVKT